jgi:hypothetical protein
MQNDNGVRITGIDIPFNDLIIFLVKLALAAIPAMLLLLGVGAVAVGILAGLGSAMR